MERTLQEKSSGGLDLNLEDVLVVGILLVIVLVILVVCLIKLLCPSVNLSEEDPESEENENKERSRFQTLNTNIAHRSIVKKNYLKIIFVRIKEVKK